MESTTTAPTCRRPWADWRSQLWQKSSPLQGLDERSQLLDGGVKLRGVILQQNGSVNKKAPIAIALHGMILRHFATQRSQQSILSVDDFHMFVILCMYINHNQNVCIYYIHDSSWFYLLGSGKTCSTIALDQALYSTLISAAQAQFGTRGGNAWRPDESWQVQGSKELSGFQGSQDMFNTISDRSCGLQLLCSCGGIQLGPASHDSRRHWTFKKVQTLRLLSDRRASHTCVSRTADVKVYFPAQ